MLREISQAQKDKNCMIPLIGGTYRVSASSREKVESLPGACGKGNEKVMFNWYRVSVLQDGKSLGDCTVM